jgi:hypothetical protein
MRNVAQRDITKPTLEACRLLEEVKKDQAYAILHCTLLKPSVRWRSQAEFFQDFFYFLVGELVYAFVFVGVAA